MIGTTLSQFKITAKLGEGGMGEVYRAEDTKLGREVAIKVLPQEVATDPERLARFEGEARAVAALSHPNILAIYDFGTQDGVTYAVMELLEGQTLREMLASGPIPARKALDLGRQVANGLAAAHDKGVTHRDLKPENLFITRKGRMKILDFGLAKWKPLAQSGEDATLAAETGPGVVLGTVGYMSPEQVRGESADHRADIFSLGTVLYEMFSGKRAFQADSAVETMSAILKTEPPELASSVEGLPASIDRVVGHCLEKDPEQRFQSAQDLAFQLEALQQTSVSGIQAMAETIPKASRSLGRTWLVAAGLVGLALGALVTSWLNVADPPTFPSFQQLTFRRGWVWSARFAAEGNNIVYGAAWEGKPVELFITSPDTPESRPLDLGTADLLSISSEGEMAVSLNRQFVVGWESQGTLARVPLDGSAPREMLENVQEADWGPDGEMLAVVREIGSRVRLEYPVGTVLVETDGWISQPRVSPEGNRVAFVAHSIRGDNVGRLRVVDLDGTVLEVSRGGTSGLGWKPDGKKLWGSRDLSIVEYSLESGEERVIYRGPSGFMLQDVAPDGRVLLSQSDIRREMVGFISGAAQEENLSWLTWSQARAISGDAKVVLFGEGNQFGPDGYSLYVRGTDASPAVRIGEGLALALSSDGRWALALLRPFGEAVPILLPTGAGEAREIPIEGVRVQPWAEFLPDGESFLIAGSREGAGPQVFHVDLKDPSARPVTPEGIGFYYEGGAVSPDGKELAAIGPDRKVYRYPLDDAPDVEVIGTRVGDVPIQWSDDGRYLFVYRITRLPARVERIDIETGERELWRELAPADAAGVFNIDMLRMTRDGESYVYSFRRLLSTLHQVEGLD